MNANDVTPLARARLAALPPLEETLREVEVVALNSILYILTTKFGEKAINALISLDGGSLREQQAATHAGWLEKRRKRKEEGPGYEYSYTRLGLDVRAILQEFYYELNSSHEPEIPADRR
jgi:hypothetical protein